MMTWKMLGVGALTLGMTAAAAQAQQQGPADRQMGDVPGPIDSLTDLQDTGRMLFKLADEDNNGTISQKEAIDAGNLLVGGFFFRADANGDGVLSKEEAQQAREAFLSTKPWLKYVVETGKATAAKQGTSKPNPLAGLASTFDSNSDQKLQATELRNAVQTAVTGMFGAADTNRDGQLTPTEMNAAMTGLARQVAQAAFAQADTDNNGSISQAEFEKAIMEPARVAFGIADLNHDGQISQQEAQTARQVIMTRLRSLNVPEPSNSLRNQINSMNNTPQR
jgi:Ca2+-binding EF-hand superfamily protein